MIGSNMAVFKVETLSDLAKAVAAAIGDDQFNFVLTVFDKNGAGVIKTYSNATDREIVAHLKSIVAEKEGRLINHYGNLN